MSEETDGLLAKKILEKMENTSLLKDVVRVSLEEHITADSLSFLDNLAVEVSSGNKTLLRILRKLSKKEKNPVEKLFFSFLGGTKITSSSYTCRQYLYFRYPKLFRELLLAYQYYKSPREALLNVMFLLKHEKIDIQKKFIIKLLASLDKGDLSLMLPYFYQYVDEKSYVAFFGSLDLLGYTKAILKLKKAALYHFLAKKMLSTTPKDTIFLINNVDTVDNALLFDYLIKFFTEEYRKSYEYDVVIHFNELFRILKLKRSLKYSLLFSWLRCFIFCKRFEDFLKIYLKVKNYDGEEVDVYRCFYNSILSYKNSNVLDFTEFVKICSEFKDTNTFAKIPLIDLASVYKFEKDV